MTATPEAQAGAPADLVKRLLDGDIGAMCEAATALQAMQAERDKLRGETMNLAACCETMEADCIQWVDRLRSAEARALAAEAEADRLRSAITKLEAANQTSERLFPIMRGPGVPWSLIAPYEAQAQRNHSQTLKRLAERGGLSICEAMAVMSSAEYEKRPIAKPTVEDWLDFIADRKARAYERARTATVSGEGMG